MNHRIPAFFLFFFVLASAAAQPQKRATVPGPIPYPIDGVPFDVAPRIVKRVDVKLPASEKRSRLKGVVLIRVTISAKGKPAEPQITRNTTGSNIAAAAAATAAMQFRYKPAMRKTMPVAAALEIPFVFGK